MRRKVNTSQEDVPEDVSNSFDLIQLKFKCMFKNVKRNHFLTLQMCFCKWNNNWNQNDNVSNGYSNEPKDPQAEHSSSTQVISLNDITKKSSKLPKDFQCLPELQQVMNKFCKPPNESEFNDQAHILTNHA